MPLRAFLAALMVASSAGAETSAATLWTELKANRDKLPGLHQEFDISQTSKFATGSRAVKRQVVLDAAQRLWREAAISGSGRHTRIFDGNDVLWMEDGGDEYERVKRTPKDGDPIPPPYRLGDPDWTKAIEVERRPCGIPGSGHNCVVLEAPLKPWTRPGSAGGTTRRVQGAARVLLDLETGLLISARTIEAFQNAGGGYQSEVSYVVRRMAYGAPADANLFKLPSADMRQVKELSRWNAAKIKKQRAGKPAPEFAVTDLQGKTISLSAVKGKVVLLDFWTTWCPPCRADGPALDKLHSKYGEKDLVIVGISVSEERALVEKFLKEHPHSYSIVLTTENELPRPYQIGVFPTYIVIDRNGTLASAMEGDQGFGDLRKALKKARVEAE